MSEQQILLKSFEYVLLLFSLSFHEAAHAWTASRMGDQTARMLGRITLNPARHIDPIGTVVLPLALLFLSPFGGNFLVGWARPTPVNTRNFRNFKQGDMLTTLAGPASNLLIAVVCVLALIVFEKLSPVANYLLHSLALGGFDPGLIAAAPVVFPAVLLLYMGMSLNLILAFFNLLPLPPLDGSHLVRHLLPASILHYYDRLGMLSLVLVFVFGARLIFFFVGPLLAIVNHVLMVM